MRMGGRSMWKVFLARVVHLQSNYQETNNFHGKKAQDIIS